MYDRRLAIESVARVGPGQFVLAFESPEIAASCEPGHFVMVSTADCIDPLLRRPMAIYRVLRDGRGEPRGFSILVEVVGRGTALLEQKVVGDTVKVLGPLGVPFRLPAADEPVGEQMLVMGGVGSAPFPLLAEELLARGHRVRAFVGARSAEHLLCVEDFVELEVPVEVATDDGSEGFHGFVVGPLERHLAGADTAGATLYACGPTPMMKAVHDIAEGRGLPLQVSFEAPMACGIGVCLSCVLPVVDDSDEGWKYARCCREGPVFDSRRLVWT
jgi:dihydroorotate dehydrogenase electron transfer subunit